METLERVRLALEANPDAIVLIVPDEEHRELLQAAIEKQNKNATAAKGTISALTKRDDPLLSRIIEGLTTLQQIAIGARPAGAQLDGTPMGEALKGVKETRGGEPETVGQVAARTVATADEQARKRGPGRRGKDTEPAWSEEVPLPRPRIGDKVVTPSGLTTEVRSAVAYHQDRNAFRVVDTDDWDGLVVPAVENGEIVPGVWHILLYLLDYKNRDAQATTANDAGGSIVDEPGLSMEDNATQFVPAEESDLTGYTTVSASETDTADDTVSEIPEEDDLDEDSYATSVERGEDSQSFETSGGIDDEPAPRQPASRSAKRSGAKKGGAKKQGKGKRRR